MKILSQDSFTGVTSNIMSLGVLENGHLISSSYNGEIFLWDVNKYKLAFKFSVNEPILTMTLLNDNYLAVSASNMIKIWDINLFKFNKTLTGHVDLIYQLIFDEERLFVECLS